MVTCPYCEKEAVFTTSEEFYGRDYGTNLYVCRPCDARIGTHGRSDKPLGTLATLELRELRKQAHAVFDPLWKKNGKEKLGMRRTEAYQWLQQVMNLSKKEAHIGKFNEAQCRKLIGIKSEEG